MRTRERTPRVCHLRECERRLAQADRREEAASPRYVCATARRIVRHHRCDASSLRWVLANVAVSAALASALLGLAAQPAAAGLSPFAAQTGAANPLDGEDIGSSSAPALVDLDGDGDLDIVAGESDGAFFYFENTGDASSPAFIEQTGLANPLDGGDVGSGSAPALGDLDGDGDLDLVAGESAGTLLYFENTGNAVSPAFVEQTGAGNPLDGEDVGDDARPTLGDLDGDGDLDLVVGAYDGVFLYYENAGDALSPDFVERTGVANPLEGEVPGPGAAPTLGDADADGDLDLLVGRESGAFDYYENTGDATSPIFVLRTGASHPLDGEDIGFEATPTLGDLDGDGDLDLVAGEQLGDFFCYENPFVKPALAAYAQTGAANPLDGADVGDLSTPALGDLDGDGDLDLVAGEQLGTFRFYENTGNATNPVFVARTGASNPLHGEDVGSYSQPALGDLDGDGDLDLVVGEFADFLYYENTGDALSPVFVERAGAANPLDAEDAVARSAPTLGDLDRDGDLDVVAGDSEGVFFYFENTGDALSPVFVARTGVDNPLDATDTGSRSVPALGDLDGDGDLDLLAGEISGFTLLYENTGGGTSPAFVARTGAANPLAAEDVGSSSAPALGDLDGDGTLDLVSGEASGVFNTYYFPEPSRGLMLAAGAVLLRLLRGLRRR